MLSKYNVRKATTRETASGFNSPLIDASHFEPLAVSRVVAYLLRMFRKTTLTQTGFYTQSNVSYASRFWRWGGVLE
jgi:hypothetical protein